MSKNPFLNFQQYETKPPRNSVDLSHRYNGTFGFGTLYPVLCCEVDPGDTFSIESAFGLKFFPMPFPIQTPMHASMHFYYVRNRTIWKDFPDFIYNNKSASVIPHPYIVRPASDREFWKTGGIADYLDVPTQIVSDGDVADVSIPIIGLSPSDNSFVDSSQVDVSGSFSFTTTNGSSRPIWIRPVLLDTPDAGANNTVPSLRNLITYDPVNYDYYGFFIGGIKSFVVQDNEIKILFPSAFATAVFSGDVTVFVFVKGKNADMLDSTCVNGFLPGSVPHFDKIIAELYFDPSEGAVLYINEARYIEVLDHVCSGLTSDQEVFLYIGCDVEASQKDNLVSSPGAALSPSARQPGSFAAVRSVLTSSSSIGDYPLGNPFAGDNPALPLSALPFRAYEAIYNAYYRNERLEPLMIDGVPEYNKYCPNMESGADNFPYRLYRRNWEADYLTSSLPTPQQGIAPVVGVAGLSDIQIQDPDSNEVYNFTAEVDGTDGETVVGGSFHDPGATTSVRRTAQEIVTAGFTINDFRNVNALQRWLENNFRRGLKYRDQILANTGVKVRYDELDMPEFIGGYSRPVQVSSITQTAPGGDAGVGDYAGQANCFGQSKHRISHYCDEAGFIVGILCVTPQPVYSQLLPKHFLKRTALDYHHPVMNHIGMQPITYDQVCPLQVYQVNPSQEDGHVRFSDVFGYQRPFYDLLAKVDTVHGQMRDTLRRYVMNRTFSDVPELGGEFVHVDPRQLNDVFNLTSGDEDVMMGEIYFRIFAKRTVSLFGQPKIV